jgi:hypothetical protein
MASFTSKSARAVFHSQPLFRCTTPALPGSLLSPKALCLK